MRFLGWINGKKTYGLALGGVVFAWLGVWLGHFSVDEAIRMSYEAAGFATLRHGVAKLG